jgi:hypothetical protein
MTERERRPTLGELASQATGGDGWECPRCGCRDWRVEDSYFVRGRNERMRRRFCRHCKQVLHTREIPIEAESEKFSPPNPANSTDADENLTRLGIVGLDGVNDDATKHLRRNRKHG